MGNSLLAGMTAFTAVPAGLLILLGVPTAALATYQVLLAVAALVSRGAGADDRVPSASATRVAVLVPAHDESALSARCVRSLRDQTYPTKLYEVVVIADNCNDDTAEAAERAGARVLVRNDKTARGRARALRWALDQVLRQEARPDAVAVVDADSVAADDFLEV